MKERGMRRFPTELETMNAADRADTDLTVARYKVRQAEEVMALAERRLAFVREYGNLLEWYLNGMGDDDASNEDAD